MKRRSIATRRQSQVATATEVVAGLVLGAVLWLTDYRPWALAALLFCCVSLLAHNCRRFRDDR